MKPTRVLVTGGAGLLGQALLAAAPDGVELHATQRNTPLTGAIAHAVELSDAAAVGRLLADVGPELLIHTAYGKQDGERAPYAEADPPSPISAYGAPDDGTRRRRPAVARSSRECSARRSGTARAAAVI